MDYLINNPREPAQACVIWLHGLGASADDMAGLAQQLPMQIPLRHVCLNAPVRPVTLNQGMLMQAWYNITGMQLNQREDQAGIVASEQQIQAAIMTQIADGFAPQQIFLAGFSQGGAMALFSGLRYSAPLGGIMSLSAYLPLASVCEPKARTDIPIFIAYGTQDPIVLPAWTQLSLEWLHQHHYHHVSANAYAMEHSVCQMELVAMASWLSSEISHISLC